MPFVVLLPRMMRAMPLATPREMTFVTFRRRDFILLSAFLLMQCLFDADAAAERCVHAAPMRCRAAMCCAAARRRARVAVPGAR